MRARSQPKRDEVVRITDAPQNAADDLERRKRNYLISMAIRTLSFIGAVAVGPGVLRWVLIAAAVFLPYVAVVFANARAPRLEGSQLLSPTVQHRELEQ